MIQRTPRLLLLSLSTSNSHAEWTGDSKPHILGANKRTNSIQEDRPAQKPQQYMSKAQSLHVSTIEHRLLLSPHAEFGMLPRPCMYCKPRRLAMFLSLWSMGKRHCCILDHQAGGLACLTCRHVLLMCGVVGRETHLQESLLIVFLVRKRVVFEREVEHRGLSHISQISENPPLDGPTEV